MRKIIIVLAFMYFAFSNAYSQYLFPFNLDFERGFVGSAPPGWQINNAANKQGYKILTENSSHSRGGKCLLFKTPAKLDDKKSAAVYNIFDALDFVNSKIRISADFKSEFSGKENFAKLWVNVKDILGNTLSYVESREFTKNEWDTLGVELNVPTCAKTITVGVAIVGIGKVYCDDVQLLDIRPSANVNTAADWNPEKNVYMKWAANILSVIKYYSIAKDENTINYNEVLRQTVKLAEQSDSKASFIKGANQLFSKLDEKFQIFESDKQPEITNSNSQKDDKYFAKMIKGVDMPYISDNSGSIPVEISKPLKNEPCGISQNLKLDNIPANTEFKLSFKAKVDKYYYSTIAGVAFRFNNSGKSGIKGFNFENTSIAGSVKEYSITGKSPAGAEFVSIFISLWGDGEFIVDDMKLEYNLNGVIKEISLENSNFEQSAASFIPGWNIPVENPDYVFSITNNPISGKGSLSIKSSSRFVLSAPLPNENIISEPAPGIKISIPFAKRLDTNYLDCNNKKLDPIFFDGTKFDVTDLYFRLGGVTELRNKIINFGIIPVSREKIDSAYDVALTAAAKANTNEAYLKVLNRFAKVYPDKNVIISKNRNSQIKTIPFNFRKIENKYIVTSVANDYQDVKIGDEIVKIDDKPIEEVINEKGQEFYTNNESLKNYRAISLIRNGEINENLNFTIRRSIGLKKINVTKNRNILDVPDLRPVTGDVLSEGVVYVDITSISDELFKELIKNFSKTKALVIDARGNSSMQEYFLSLFKTKELQNINVNVNHYFTEKYKSKFDITNYLKGLGKLKDLKLVFLTDVRTSGMAEYIINVAKLNNIGTIVGQTTSGSIGKTTFSKIIGDYLINFTTLEYKDNKGNMLNNSPISPDIWVNYSQDDIIKGNDTMIDKALEILK